MMPPNRIDNSQDKDKKVQMVTTQMQAFFSGPLPPPEVFQKYELILPGSADRILKMAEDQSTHRRDLEKTVVGGEQFRANKGLWFGFIIGMTTIVGGLFLIYFDKQWQGFIFSLGGLVALVGTFIFGKKEKESDLSQKEKGLLERVAELEKRLDKNKIIIDGNTIE